MSTIEKAMEALQGKEPENNKKSEEIATGHLLQEGDVKEESIEENSSAVSAEQSPSHTEQDNTIDSKEAVEGQSTSEPEVTVTAEKHQKENERAVPEQSPVSAEKTETARYAELDITYLNRKGYVSKDSDNKVTKEQFRAVKRKLLNNAFGPLSSTLNHPNLIIVSSCNPHEGKTFSSINLALNIALERDKTVLLVDADVVRPSIVRELGVTVENGLTEFLSGQVSDVSDIIYSSNIDNFKFIPAGQPHDLSTELLASQKMVDLTNELATRYSDRIVIFDAPPLLGVNETHVMANHVGQAVIVVEESKTKLNDVKAAISQLDENLAIGFLMNKSKRAWRDYYGYGYGYYRQK